MIQDGHGQSQDIRKQVTLIGGISLPPDITELFQQFILAAQGIDRRVAGVQVIENPALVSFWQKGQDDLAHRIEMNWPSRSYPQISGQDVGCLVDAFDIDDLFIADRHTQIDDLIKIFIELAQVGHRNLTDF